MNAPYFHHKNLFSREAMVSKIVLAFYRVNQED